ncbi:MAG: FeoA family protein [Pseudomonadota bacterium]
MTSDIMTLDELNPGDKAVIKGLKASALRGRLIEMGVVPGVCIHLKREAPLTDPIEIRIRGNSLSIRRSEAKCIEVERVERCNNCRRGWRNRIRRFMRRRRGNAL